MTDQQNPHVIMSSNSHSDGKHYHTDICRNVPQINDKRYPTEAEAKARGATECDYCRGEFTKPTGRGRGHYQALVREAKKRRAEGD